MQFYTESAPFYGAKTFHYPDGGVETVAWRRREQRPAMPGGPVLRRRGEAPNQEARECNVRRAKTRVRRLCRSMGVDRMLTFTTRETANGYETLKADWDLLRRRVLKVYPDFRYVAVVEQHPSNPDHAHLHVAVSGFRDVNILRREWHAVLRRRIADGYPGSVNVRKHANAPARIARYIAKYLGKTLGADTWVLNRKSYWASKGAASLLRRSTWFPCAETWRDLEAELIGDDCIYEVRHFNPAPGVLWLEARVSR